MTTERHDGFLPVPKLTWSNDKPPVFSSEAIAEALRVSRILNGEQPEEPTPEEIDSAVARAKELGRTHHNQTALDMATRALQESTGFVGRYETPILVRDLTDEEKQLLGLTRVSDDGSAMVDTAHQLTLNQKVRLWQIRDYIKEGTIIDD